MYLGPEVLSDKSLTITDHSLWICRIPTQNTSSMIHILGTPREFREKNLSNSMKILHQNLNTPPNHQSSQLTVQP